MLSTIRLCLQTFIIKRSMLNFNQYFLYSLATFSNCFSYIYEIKFDKSPIILYDLSKRQG